MLQAIDNRTCQPVEIGDEIIDFRGEKAILVSLDRVNEFRYGGRRSGLLTFNRNGDAQTVYDKVFGISVIETDWEDSEPHTEAV